MSSTTKVCDHLSLGVCTCTSNSSTKKRKLVTQATDGATKKTCNVDSWKIRKVLKKSDVDHSSRLLLGKILAEDFVLSVLGVNALEEDEEIEVQICDIDTNSSVHSVKLKKWRSGSYVFMGGWAKNFVARRGLKKGDEIGLHWDQYNKHFNFCVLRSSALPSNQDRH